MITRETIENYAEIQGGRCLEVFSMKDEMLADDKKKATAKGFLDQRIQLLAESTKTLPLDKTRRLNYVIETYDLEVLMMHFQLLAKERSRSLGAIAASFALGGVVRAAFSYITGLEVEGLDEKEKSALVEGLMLISLWDAVE